MSNRGTSKQKTRLSKNVRSVIQWPLLQPRGLGFFGQLALHTSGILSGVFLPASSGFFASKQYIAVDTISSLWRAEKTEIFWVVLLCLLRGSEEAGRTDGQSSTCKIISEPSKSLNRRSRRDPSAVTFPEVSHNIFEAGLLFCFLGFFFF